MSGSSQTVSDAPYTVISSIMDTFRSFTSAKDGEVKRIDSIPVPSNVRRAQQAPEPYEVEVTIDLEEADILDLQVTNTSNNEVEVGVTEH